MSRSDALRAPVAVLVAVVMAMTACDRSHELAPRPGSADTSRAEVAPAPPPPPRFFGLDAIVAAGDSARGKTAELRVARGETRAGDFTAYECAEPRSMHRMFLAYRPDQIDAVRAIDGSCGDAPARVRFTVVSGGSAGFTGLPGPDGRLVIRHDTEQIVSGRILEVLDVAPRPATTVPAGVDLGSFDDMTLASPSATGRVAQFEARRSSPSADAARLSITPCAEGARSNVIVLAVPEELAGNASDVQMNCVPVRFRVGEREPLGGSWSGTLLGLPTSPNPP